MRWIAWVVDLLRTSLTAFFVWGTFFLADKYLAFYQKPLNQQIIIGLFGLIIITVVNVFLSYVLGPLYYLLWLKRRDMKERHVANSTVSTSPKNFWGIGITLFSIISIAIGIILLYQSRVVAVFLGAFLCFTGAQILLWRMGISLEIISNVPSVIDSPKADVD